MAPRNDRDYVIRLEHENAELRAQIAGMRASESRASSVSSSLGERLSQGSEYFPGVVILYDAERRIQFANSVGVKLAGVELDRLIGCRDEEILPREITDLYLHCLLRAIETRSEQSHEFTVPLPSGTFRTRLTYIPLLDRQGAIVQILAFAQDISRQVKAEHRASELEEQFIKAFQAGPVPSVISHLDDGIIADANKSFCALIGHTREELVGRTAAEKGVWVNPEDRVRIAETLRAGKPVRGMHVNLRAKSGTVKPFLFCADKIEIGGIDCMISHLEDLTLYMQAQRALKEKEETFRALAEYTPDIIVRFDRQGRFAYVNNLTGRLSGIPADQFIGKTPAQLSVPRRLVPLWRKRIEYVLEHACPTSLEFEYPTTLGPRTYEAQLVPEFDADGNVSHVLTVSRDITERIQTHQQLEERVRERTEELARSQERFRQIYDSNMISIAYVDLRGRITSANEAFLELTGYTREDVVEGRVRWNELTPPKWAGCTRRALDELLAVGRVTPYEQEYIRKDGTRVAVLVGGATLAPNLEERVAFVLDDSERQSAQEEIKRLYHNLEQRASQVDAERARWQSVVEGIADEVWICDVSGHVNLLNQSAVNVIGLEEFGNKRIDEIRQEVDILDMEGRVRPPEESPLLRSLRGEVVRGEEIVRHRRTGATRYRQFSSAPLRDGEGNITGSVAIIRDITEYKQTEKSLLEAMGRIQRLNHDLEFRTTELEAANRELESFSYSVSHDLRTPAAAIGSLSHILLDECAGDLDDHAKRYVEAIHANAQQMDELIQALLQFSRATRQPLRRESISMHDLVEQALQELGMMRRGRQVDIVLGKLPEVNGDRLLLKQVMTNLLSNALKYTRKREGARIVVNSYIKNGEQVYYVKDNGVGFDRQHADKLFGVFQRFHAEDEYEGTGVGLALVERIIRRHGGWIRADSAEGRGATFFFTVGDRRG